MLVEIWSDIVCPWCYIGKRRLETALSDFEHADEVEIVWRSFQLDPSHPKGLIEPTQESLARKFGSKQRIQQAQAQVGQLAEAEGLHYDFENAVSINTFDAHRLIHLATKHGKNAEAHERLMRANLVEAATLDTDTLVKLAEELQVPADEARQVLEGDAYTDEVNADIAQARAYGASGVPFFVLDRKYGISGAQSADVFRQALATAHAG